MVQIYFFSHGYIHKQNKLSLILQIAMTIAHLLAIQMVQDQDLGVQDTWK